MRVSTEGDQRAGLEIVRERDMGGDIVGMSTALEAIAAREAGMEVLGMSLITNLAAGVQATPLSHEEVLQAGKASCGKSSTAMLL